MISGVGRHLLNLHLMTIYNSTSFIDQFLGDSFSLESNETEVLGFIVLRLVDWSDNLCNCSKLTEVVLDVLLVTSCLRQLTNINLPLLDISLLYSDGLTLNLMFHMLDFSEFFKILLQLILSCLLGKTSNKQLAIFLECLIFVCHFDFSNDL